MHVVSDDYSTYLRNRFIFQLLLMLLKLLETRKKTISEREKWPQQIR